MMVIIDDDACAGHGVCVAVCPQVFALTADGYAEAVRSEIPPELEASVVDAIDGCPEHAITTTRGPSDVD